MGELTVYELLGVDPTVTDAELRQAYLGKVQALHPDRNDDPDAQRELGRLNAAWRCVNQPARRAGYDLRIAAEEAQRVRREERLEWEARRQADEERAAVAAAMAAVHARPGPPPPPPAPPERKPPRIKKETVQRATKVALDIFDAFFGGKK